MALHRIKKGLDLPITGMPDMTIDETKSVSRVAVLADDVIGLKPRMRVAVGETVRRGTPLFEHRKRPGLLITAPAAGVVVAINRGERRALRSVVIELSAAELQGEGEQVVLNTPLGDAETMREGDIRALLVESGLWSAFRERPFSTIPAPDSPAPGAVFINATDSNPGAPDMKLLVAGASEDLQHGLVALSKLSGGQTFLVCAPGMRVDAGAASNRVRVEEFAGRHPYGLVGLHMHFLYPVNRERKAWYMGVQDAIAVGRLIRTGQIDVSRVVSLSGPQVARPRLVRTRLGASIDELVGGEIYDSENRVISGSVFSGRRAMGEVEGYLGRYDQQVSVVREGRERELLGWLGTGPNKFSVIRTFVSKLMPGRKFDFTTTTHGSHRAMVPIGMYEKVMPMDILPTFLLRALAMGDVERAEALGCLELDEEDLALCTFVDPGKTEYGPLLRKVLTTIQEEG